MYRALIILEPNSKICTHVKVGKARGEWPGAQNERSRAREIFGGAGTGISWLFVQRFGRGASLLPLAERRSV